MRKWIKWVLIVLVAIAATLLALSFLTYRPLPPRSSEAPSTHITDTADTVLGRSVTRLRADHTGQTGIYPLADGRDAFAIRAALSEVAEKSIDVQYYIWHDDVSGRLLLQSLRRAADRGVRVRLLLDDNNTGGMDGVLMGLDAHPNFEVRVFNPLMHREWRVLDYLSDFARTNRRMHNKSFTVDNQTTVVGGRNVGDEYFGAGDGVMFADLDVLAAGEVVGSVSSDFDRYWASESTYPISSIVPKTTPPIDIGTTPANNAATQTYLKALAQSGLVEQLHSGSIPLEWTSAQMISDDPIKGLGKASREQTLMGRARQVVDSAQNEFTIVSPYFVPTQAGTDELTELAKRGVKVTVLTNSLSATDVAAVHSGYAKYRKELLRAGVKLYELKPSATIVATGTGGLTGSSGASLHAKTFEVDGKQVFVGSFNMDPRSAALNTEMGLLIESPNLAAQLPASLAANGANNSYVVTLDGNNLRWTTNENGQSVTFEREPHASWLRRASVVVMSWLPIEWML